MSTSVRRWLALAVVALLGSLLVTAAPAIADGGPADPPASSYVCVTEPNAQFPFIQLRSLPTADAEALVTSGDAYWPTNGSCLRLDPPNVAMCSPRQVNLSYDLVWIGQPDVERALAAGYTFAADGQCVPGADQSLTVCVTGPNGNVQRVKLPSGDADRLVQSGGAYWPDRDKCGDTNPGKVPVCVGDQLTWVDSPNPHDGWVAPTTPCNADTPTVYVCLPGGPAGGQLHSVPAELAQDYIDEHGGWWPTAGSCAETMVPNVPVCVTDATGPVLIWVKSTELDDHLADGGFTPAAGSCVDAIRTIRLCVPTSTGYQLTSVALAAEAGARAGGAVDPVDGNCPAPVDKRLVCWFNGKHAELVQVLRAEVAAKIATPDYWLPTASRGCQPATVPLTITKATVGGDAQFELTVGGVVRTLSGGQSVTVQVPFRQAVSFTETMPGGWVGASIVCDGAQLSGITLGSPVTGTVEAEGYLGASCTITNALV